MRLLWCCSFIGFVLGAFVAFPKNIQPIQSHLEVSPFKECHETLVIYDVDETLIQPTDSYVANAHTPKGRHFLEQFMNQHPHIHNWGVYQWILLRDAKRLLIEKPVLSIIDKFRKRGAKVIALTSMNTGKIGCYGPMEVWRYHHLKSLGFVGDFSNQTFSLKGFDRHPVFYQGILAADLENKGDVLNAFLRHIHFTPRHIIAIDDSITALGQIQEYCNSKGIGFTGYLYKGHQKIPWNSDLIHCQANHLMEHHAWISDEEAYEKCGLFPA